MREGKGWWREREGKNITTMHAHHKWQALWKICKILVEFTRFVFLKCFWNILFRAVWSLGVSVFSQARARLELREEATEQDARNVVEIMKFRYRGVQLTLPQRALPSPQYVRHLYRWVWSDGLPEVPTWIWNEPTLTGQLRTHPHNWLLHDALKLCLQAKRLVCALTRAANQTSNSLFTIQQIKDIARVSNAAVSMAS